MTRRDSSDPLSELLLRLDEQTRQRIAQDPGLHRFLATGLAEVERRWCGGRAAPPAWYHYLAARVPRDGTLERALHRWHLDDLYLCYACMVDAAGARDAFYQRQLPVIQSTLKKLRLGAALRQELQQELIMRLLLGDGGGPPLIASYAGLGRLSAWIRVVTERAARKALHREKRSAPRDDGRLAELFLPHQDALALPLAKARYRKAFRSAFREAMGCLSAREVAMLKQRFVDSRRLEEIAATYRVHCSTIHRQLERLYQALLRRTMVLFSQRLAIPAEECSTVFRLIQSDLDISLKTFFARGADEVSSK